MWFEIVREIRSVEVVAVGLEIREIGDSSGPTVRGVGVQPKGVAEVRLGDGSEVTAEVHWYEAHRIGSREHKIKRLLS